MGKIIVNDISQTYRVSAALTDLVPNTRAWATSLIKPNLMIPLAYSYPFGARCVHVVHGSNVGYPQVPFMTWSAPGNNINYIEGTDGGRYDAESVAMPVAYVTTSKVSDYLKDYNTIKECVADINNWVQPFYGFPDKIDLNTDDYADWLVLEDCYFYDNSDNGNYSDFNQRKQLPDQNYRDVYFVINYTRTRSYSSNSNFSDHDVDAQVGLSIRAPFHKFGYADDRPKAIPFFMTTVQGAPWENFGKRVNFYNSSGGGKLCTIVPNLDAIKQYFAMWGMPVFFDDDIFSANIPEPGVPDNPTDPDTPGSGDNNVDPMVVDPPSISPVSAVTMQYAATGQEIGKLIDWLMTDDFLTNISKFLNEPTEYLIGCKYYPFDLSLHSPLGVGPAGIYRVGNMNTPLGVTAAPIYSDFNRKLGECSFLVEPYYGNFLDYSPYTKYDLYLPYIGYKTIDPNDIVNSTLKVVYYTDLTEGRVLAQVWADTIMLESFEGQLAYDIPLSSSDGRERAVKTIQIAANAVSTIGGAAFAGSAFGGAKGVAKGVAMGAVGGIISSAPSTISQLTSMTPQIDKGGTISSDLNGFNPQDIYLIMTRPIMAQPKNFAQVQGYAASYGGKISEFSGYLQCHEILGGTGATAAENDMINELLRGGIHID